MNGHVQVVKKAGAKLQIRVVQPALVEHWSQRIRSLARDVSRINEVSLFLQQPIAVHTFIETALQMPAHERAQAGRADMKVLGCIHSLHAFHIKQVRPAGMSPLAVSRGGGPLQEEREEMELRKAEMEAAKAENMVEHEAEINARPARTWFQTRKEKEASTTR